MQGLWSRVWGLSVELDLSEEGIGLQVSIHDRLLVPPGGLRALFETPVLCSKPHALLSGTILRVSVREKDKDVGFLV